MAGRLTMAYRIIRGKVTIPKEYVFTENKSLSRNNNSIKLMHKQTTSDVNKYAFSQRSVPEWNNLPAHLVYADPTETFRKLLAEYPSSD